ncbi:HNH endonuclease [Cohnella lubricantis]|uniref:Putative HNH nuclease YajD n=1 Tax=Cohnella lubricantis TaxID=2163172 RepID=A0A841T7L8_9BACL|nr:HNH endonuclease [Cohnella lubricantis]MBB6677513.1 HNH endonuclease [Cohnella lubricantis]MBP2116601.1 5-methylcytosine-specific restriction endonuclease McrA [Cohnella lubricantis]
MGFYKTRKWINKREKVLRRDEYMCRECRRYGKTSAATTVHHINQLRDHPELALAEWNLISLCGRCHDKMHDRTTDALTALGQAWVERMRPTLEIL